MTVQIRLTIKHTVGPPDAETPDEITTVDGTAGESEAATETARLAFSPDAKQMFAAGEADTLVFAEAPRDDAVQAARETGEIWQFWREDGVPSSADAEPEFLYLPVKRYPPVAEAEDTWETGAGHYTQVIWAEG